MYIKLYEREERDLGIFHYCMKRDNKEQFANYLLGNPEMIKADIEEWAKRREEEAVTKVMQNMLRGFPAIGFKDL